MSVRKSQDLREQLHKWRGEKKRDKDYFWENRDNERPAIEKIHQFDKKRDKDPRRGVI